MMELLPMKFSQVFHEAISELLMSLLVLDLPVQFEKYRCFIVVISES